MVPVLPSDICADSWVLREKDFLHLVAEAKGGFLNLCAEEKEVCQSGY